MSPTKEPKVTEAVRELRLALGESQEAFAQRLKASVRSIARYETIRPPRGKPLAQLHRIAVEENLKGVAAVLSQALTRELYGDGDGLPERFDKSPPRARAFHLGLKKDSEGELILEAVNRVLQNTRYKHLQKPLIAVLAPIIKDMKKEANEFVTERFRELEISEGNTK
jgi:transcriptional regulator with XRE-family HTH domain